MNIGLSLMVGISLLPIGLLQAWASVTEGMWYARSAEFMHQPIIEALVWLRVPGDIVFSAGGAMLAWFAYRLWRGRPLNAQAVPVSRATKPAE